MFHEVHYGYVGLGSTDIFRTAAQAAADIEEFGAQLPVPASGGLFEHETLFTFSTAQGRLKELSAGIKDAERRIEQLKAQMDAIVRELEDAGVKGAVDYLKMAVTTAFSLYVPVVGFALQYGFGMMSEKELKKLVERKVEEYKRLAAQANMWAERHVAMGKEYDELLAAAQQGKDALKTTIVGIGQKEVRKTLFDAKTMTLDRTRKTVDVVDPWVQTHAELKARSLTPTGARLPEGFQMLYSPALKGKAIVTKLATPTAQPALVTGQKLVFGGLAGLSPAQIDDIGWNVLKIGAVIGIGVFMAQWMRRR